MNIPTEKTIKLSEAQRFIEGLKELIDECGMSAIRYNFFGPLEFEFNDGSTVGSIRAAMDSGMIDEDTYNEKYRKEEVKDALDELASIENSSSASQNIIF